MRTLNIERPHRRVQCVTLYCVTLCASKPCRGRGRGWGGNVACLPVLRRPPGLSRAQLHFIGLLNPEQWKAHKGAYRAQTRDTVDFDCGGLELQHSRVYDGTECMRLKWFLLPLAGQNKLDLEYFHLKVEQAFDEVKYLYDTLRKVFANEFDVRNVEDARALECATERRIVMRCNRPAVDMKSKLITRITDYAIRYLLDSTTSDCFELTGAYVGVQS